MTGSEGNVGTYMVKRIHELHPDWRVIRIAYTKTPGRTKVLPNEKLYTGDLVDLLFVQRIFSEQVIDYVIHAAAKAYSFKYFKEAPYSLLRHDNTILMNVLDAAQKIKKFVYLSSSTVYESGNESPFTEEMTDRIPAPTSLYGQAKLFGEQLVRAFTQQTSVPYTIFRAFNIVSPLEPHDTGDGHVFISFYKKIFADRATTIEILGNGDQIRCFTWVEDVANVIVDTLDDERTKNKILNIGNTESITLRELLEKMINIGKKLKLLPSEYRPTILTGGAFQGVDSQRRIPSVEKIEKLLGWKPVTDLERCFTQFIADKNK